MATTERMGGRSHPDRLTVFSNIPNPYNGFLYSAMADLQWDLRVVYKGIPGSEGRPWNIPLRDNETVAGSLKTELDAILHCHRRGGHAVLTGGYFGKCEAMRRLVLKSGNVCSTFWGERLSPGSGARRVVRRRTLSGFDAIFAVGSWAVDCYREAAPETVVHVFPYTTGGSTQSRDLEDACVVGFVGSLIERKGLDVLLNALAGLDPLERPRLDVVGSGPLEGALRALAEQIGVNVRWLGELTAEQLGTARSRWWVQAVPSRYDGWGMVVAEALQAGVPVVASAEVGAARDMVRPGLNGSVVGQGEDWSAALAPYLDRVFAEDQSWYARLVGTEFSAPRAARWLHGLLRSGVQTTPRSFVDDAWEEIQVQLGSRRP